jgi:hypothetical protein
MYVRATINQDQGERGLQRGTKRKGQKNIPQVDQSLGQVASRPS